VIARLAGVALAAGAAWIAYTYAGYPLVLWLRTRGRRRPVPQMPTKWPAITVLIPVHNGAPMIGATLDAVLALDYPADRRQVLVVSDASSDATDAIVAQYGARGVELFRLERRVGKTAAENAALARVRGEIVVHTDAAIRLHPLAAKRLVAALGDPTVGVASGRDVSVASRDTDATLAESGYVGYEMWVRDLETRLGGIVGASGSLSAIRRELLVSLPPALARDFAAVLVARERGYRAISVPEALCLVPRGESLRREYHRKVRTMTRGLETLLDRRRLLDPRRDAVFAWMLFSHKLCRWLAPWAGLVALVALAVLAVSQAWARWLALGAGAGALLGIAGWWWSGRGSAPRLLSIPGYLVAGAVATLQAWSNVARRDLAPAWEPTRRPAAPG